MLPEFCQISSKDCLFLQQTLVIIDRRHEIDGKFYRRVL